MGLLTLYCGLLLPWLGGALWLAVAEFHLSHHTRPHRLRQAGYGFFLGYAVLFLAIEAGEKLTGAVSWSGVMLFLLVFSALAAVMLWRSSKVKTTVRDDSRRRSYEHQLAVPGSLARTSWHSAAIQASPGVKILTTVMLIWMAIHLVFISVEIFTQPLYPWDAWLAWVYRAKVWFMAGGIVTVTSAGNWATATSADTYTIGAWIYPHFPSIIPYWAALSLGQWSETLINLPVLFAGLAIGMALYGQCREYGLSASGSLAACYLLYSIPLFGTHLALAGYADIWMAGFTGLGFMAVIRGVALPADFARLNFHVMLGLLLAGLGIMVKNEGVVWFLAIITMFFLSSFRLRVSITVLLALMAVTTLTVALGFSHIELPLVGTLGFVDGRLLIPFIGNFGLEVHDIWRVYWDNLMTMGSWNLLWLLVAGSAVLVLLVPNKASASYLARRTGLVFIAVFLATQLFIFGFTDQGAWADTYTAINRLPLHFIPALLFAMLIITHSTLLVKQTQKPFRQP